MKDKLDNSKGIPALPLWLGVSGLVPFVVAAGLSFLRAPINPATAVYALIAYGAVILSFLGGVHWGVALTRGQTGGSSSGPSGQIVWYMISVGPSLVAWLALLLAPVPGLLVLAISFLAMTMVDVHAARVEQVPTWYPRLRVRLSAVVILSLLVTAWAQS